MAILKARNYELVGAHTKIKSAVSTGDTSISVDSTAGFNANDWIVIGNPGEENCEIKRIKGITDSTTFSIEAITYSHLADEGIFFVPYDQIEFGRRTTSGGTTTVITTKTMNYEDDYTSHDYPSSSTSDYYVYRYKNSYTSNYSSYQEEVQIVTLYCTVEDVADYLNMEIRNDTEIVYDQVERMIKNVTSQIDMETNSSFKVNTISTSDYEYHDGVGGKISVDGLEDSRTEYWLRHTPVISITSLDVTTAEDTTDSPTWNSLTENNDYYLDKDTGRIDIVTSSYFPPKGNKRIRVAYTWGRNSVPNEIRKLAILMVKRDLMLGGAAGTIITKGSAYELTQLSVLNNEIEKIINRYRRYQMNIT